MTDSNRRRRFLPEWGQQNLGRTLAENETAGPQPREHRPVPRPRRRRADRDGPAGGELPAHAGRRRPARVPRARRRSPPSTATRRRAGRPTATPSRPTAGSRSGSTARATCPTSTCCRCTTGAAIEREVDVNGVRAKLGPGVTRVPVRQRDVRSPADHDHPRRPAARATCAAAAASARSASPASASARRCARRSSPAGRWPAATCATRRSPTCSSARPRTSPSAATATPTARRSSSSGTARTPSASSTAWSSHPRRAPTRSTPGCSPTSPRPTACWTAPAACAVRRDVRVVLALPEPGLAARVERLRRPRRHRLDGHLDPAVGPLSVDLLDAPAARSASRGCGFRRRARPCAGRRACALSWAGGSTPPLRVGRRRHRAPAPSGARARLPPDGRRRALPGRDDDAASEPRAPSASPRSRSRGWPRSARRATGALRTLLRRRGRRGRPARGVPLRLRGTVQDLLAGRPLRARGCERARPRWVPASSGSAPCPASFAVDLLRLRSPAPAPVAAAPAGGARAWSTPAGWSPRGSAACASPWTGRPGSCSGQSFSKGWEATCDGRSLGEPRTGRRLRQRLAGARRLPGRRLQLHAAERRAQRAAHLRGRSAPCSWPSSWAPGSCAARAPRWSPSPPPRRPTVRPACRSRRRRSWLSRPPSR